MKRARSFNKTTIYQDAFKQYFYQEALRILNDSSIGYALKNRRIHSLYQEHLSLFGQNIEEAF